MSTLIQYMLSMLMTVHRNAETALVSRECDVLNNSHSDGAVK